VQKRSLLRSRPPTNILDALLESLTRLCGLVLDCREVATFADSIRITSCRASIRNAHFVESGAMLVSELLRDQMFGFWRVANVLELYFCVPRRRKNGLLIQYFARREVK
jgi:hypothetical protein